MTAVIAHRGGAIPWPENSLSAFRGAIGLGADAVECDVQLSADGVPMVIHDATLDRTTEARGAVGGHVAAALSAIRLRGARGETVPSLQALCEMLRPARAGLRLEVKDETSGKPHPDALAGALAVLDATGMRGRCTIIAFHGPTAAAAARVPGLAGVAWLVEDRLALRLGIAGVLAVARSLGVPSLGPQHTLVGADLVLAAREAGLGLDPWTANAEPDIARLLAAGVASITTDDPSLALRMRAALAA